jgi:hypothetical protein
MNKKIFERGERKKKKKSYDSLQGKLSKYDLKC